MDEIMEKQYDFLATTNDIRRVPDPYRNIIQKFEEDADGVAVPGTPDPLAATVYEVLENNTLLISSVDVEADVETIVYLEVSTDNGVTYTAVRQFKLASKGELQLSYIDPFSFTGTASGATATKVRLSFDQPGSDRMSAGFNGRLIES
jgi:hypothetical protein